jgi:hypothetical protein
MTTETKPRAPAAPPNKVRRQRVAIRKLEARVRELEAEVARLRAGAT